MNRLGKLARAAALAVLVAGCAPSALPQAAPPQADSTIQGQGQGASGGLLRAARGGDGDSWKDTQGREYRLGMVNAPEYNECWGEVATAKRRALTAAGFRAQVYAKDRYGRLVAVITNAAGVNLNVWMARHGYVDDRYLAQFHEQNPLLAAELTAAFAAAKAEQAGLWKACRHP